MNEGSSIILEDYMGKLTTIKFIATSRDFVQLSESDNVLIADFIIRLHNQMVQLYMDFLLLEEYPVVSPHHSTVGIKSNRDKSSILNLFDRIILEAEMQSDLFDKTFSVDIYTRGLRQSCSQILKLRNLVLEIMDNLEVLLFNIDSPLCPFEIGNVFWEQKNTFNLQLGTELLSAIKVVHKFRF